MSSATPRFPGLNLTFEVREGIIKHSHDYSRPSTRSWRNICSICGRRWKAQLIDLTDEIAYNTADLDDGFEARLLKLPKFANGVPVFERYYREAEAKYPDAPDKLKFNEALKRMLDRFVTDLIENTQRRVLDAGIGSLDELRGYPERLAGFSPEVEAERREAKSFLYEACTTASRWTPRSGRRKKSLPTSSIT